METVVGLAVGVAAIVALAWLASGPRRPRGRSRRPRPGRLDYARAVGLAGGSAADALKLEYVLSRTVPPGESPTSEAAAAAALGLAAPEVVAAILRDDR